MVFPRPDKDTILFHITSLSDQPTASVQDIPENGLLTLAVGDLLVDCEVLGVSEYLQSPARLVVKDKRTPIAWGFHASGNADLPTNWERGDSAYDPGVHVSTSASM